MKACMKRPISLFQLSWLSQLCLFCLLFVACDNKSKPQSDPSSAPTVQQTERDFQDRTIDSQTEPQRVEGQIETDSKPTDIAPSHPEAPVAKSLPEDATKEDSSQARAVLESSDLQISKIQAGHSVWQMTVPSLDKNIGIAFAIAPNRFISTFQLFDHIMSNKITLEQLKLSKQNGEELALKQIVKVDPVYDLVLFETQSSVSHYIDTNVYLDIEDHSLSSVSKISMISYIEQELAEIKASEETLYQDSHFYIYPVDVSQWRAVVGAPLFKEGKLIAVQSRNIANFNMAIKAQHLQKFIHQDSGDLECFDLKIIDCVEKALLYLQDTYAQNKNPVALYHLYKLNSMDFSSEEWIEEFRDGIKMSTKDTVIRNLLIQELAQLLIQQNPTRRKRFIGWFEAAAEQGFAPAQYQLGMIYLQALYGVERSYKKAFEFLLVAAKQGYAPAQYQLGNMYLYGDHVDKDPDEAKKWYKKSADQNFPLAQHDLGFMYYTGEFVEKNKDEAFDLFKKAALQGIDLSQYFMGLRFLNEAEGDQDLREAFEWLKKSANQGFPLAYFRLGGMYFSEWVIDDEGSVVEDSLIQAYIYLSLAENSEMIQEDKESLSLVYDSIDEIWETIRPEDLAKAQYTLGKKYLEGDGVLVNLELAFNYFEESALRDYAPGQRALGVMYLEGHGIEKNYEEAFYWLQEAANQADAMAQNYLGYMYLNGYGVEQDNTKAFEWFEKSANQAFVTAENNLGYMYMEGLGVEQSYTEAALWFERASKQGSASSQNLLGDIYFEALHGIRDLSKAVKWYKKSADQGFASAQVKMGVFYWEGIKDGETVILERDPVWAYYYMHLALYNGFNEDFVLSDRAISVYDYIEYTIGESISEEDVRRAKIRLKRAGYK